MVLNGEETRSKWSLHIAVELERSIKCTGWPLGHHSKETQNGEWKRRGGHFCGIPSRGRTSQQRVGRAVREAQPSTQAQHTDPISIMGNEVGSEG